MSITFNSEGLPNVGKDSFMGVNNAYAYVPNSTAWLEAPNPWNRLNLVFSSYRFNVSSSNTVTIYGYVGTDTVITIPSNGLGRTVTAIGNNVFDGKTFITSITIPASVTSIDQNAFQGCSNLTSVTFSPGSQIYTLGGYAFSLCAQLKRFILNRDRPPGDSNITIFDGSYDVTVYAPRTQAWINYAFYDTYENINNPYGITNVWMGRSLVLSPYTITDASNGKVAVTGYFGTDTVITIPSDEHGNTVTAIGPSAFQGNTFITSVTIPASVTSIGIAAFANCSALTGVKIPTSITDICNNAFQGCSNLTSITINSNTPPTNVGTNAFTGVPTVAKVFVPRSQAWLAVTSPWNGLNLVLSPYTFTDASNGKVTVTGYFGTDTVITIPSDDGLGNTVTAIGNNAFDGKTLITSVTIPASVTSIGNGAFQGCSNLTSVTLNSNTPPTTVGINAFSGVSADAKAYVPKSTVWLAAANLLTNNKWNGLTLVLPPYTFTDASNGKVTIKTFFGTDTVITIPSDDGRGNTVTAIGNDVFDGKTFITSITIPVGITSIGERAFANCSGLTSIMISASVTMIRDNAFLSCSGLTSVTFAPGSLLTEIGYGAFYLDSKLTNITIPDRVTYINQYAFGGCSDLTRVVLPAALTSIDYNAFYNCVKLTSVTFNSETLPTNVSANAFTLVNNAKAYVPLSYAWLAVTSPWYGLSVEYYGAPPPPTGVTATYTISSGFTLTWSGNSKLTYSVYDDKNIPLIPSLQSDDNTYTILRKNIPPGTYRYYVIATYKGVSSERIFSNRVTVSAGTTPATINTPPIAYNFVLSGSPLSTVVLTEGSSTPAEGFYAFQDPSTIVTTNGAYPVIFYPTNTQYSPSVPTNIQVYVITLEFAAASLSYANTPEETAAAAVTLITGFSDEAKEQMSIAVPGESIELNEIQIQNVLENAPYPAPGLDPATVTQLTVIVPDNADNISIPTVGNAYIPLITNKTYFATGSTATRKILYDGAGKLYIGPATTTADRTPLDTTAATSYVPGDMVNWTGGFTFGIPVLGGFGMSAGGSAPCFPAGTRILTAAGYKAVENLNKSDRIVTSDGRSVPFIPYYRVIEKTTAATAPYYIPAGTFKNKAITLSPHHAIQSSKGVWQIPYLAAKKFTGIRQVNLGERVEYYHIELPNFFTDNIVAEGNVVESYAGKQTHGIKTIYTHSVRLQGYTRISPAKKTLTA